ncbi:hypothetical protein ACTXT7_017228, partial [Hymenolepis weldensis]
LVGDALLHEVENFINQINEQFRQLKSACSTTDSYNEQCDESSSQLCEVHYYTIGLRESERGRESLLLTVCVERKDNAGVSLEVNPSSSDIPANSAVRDGETQFYDPCLKHQKLTIVH